jgi:hAT family C-terminal dimerisation region
VMVKDLKVTIFKLNQIFHNIKGFQKKTMSGETVRDERGDNISVSDLFKVETFFVICDSAFQSVSGRFNNNEEFLKDCASMDPKYFEDIIENGLSSKRLECIAKLMKADRATLAQQLTQFANYFKAFGQPLHQVDESQASDSDDGKSDDESDEASRYVGNESNDSHQDCMSCLACATKILHKHNLYSSMYTELYMAYKFILTMPSTQVTCERVFSKLKIIKSKLRSTIGQDLLESLLLMNIERTFFITNSEYDLIIDEIASQSAELKRLLII